MFGPLPFMVISLVEYRGEREGQSLSHSNRTRSAEAGGPGLTVE